MEFEVKADLAIERAFFEELRQACETAVCQGLQKICDKQDARI
jgi:hypothetical protein